MKYLYIYIVFFALFILFTKNKSKKLVFIATLLMFILSAVSAVRIYDIMYSGTPIILEAVLFHIAMFFLILYPLQKYDRYKYVGVKQSPEKKIRLLSIIIIVLCLFKMYFDIQNVNLATLMSDVGSLRAALVNKEYRITNSIIRYIIFFAGQYWSIALCLSFYYMIFYPQKRLMILLLLLSSLGVIVSGMAVAAREYLIKYIYLFLILTYWFSSYLSNKWRNKIKIFLIVIASTFISFFLIITILRFGKETNYSYSALDSMLSYYGQGFINFSSIFEEFPNGATGGALKFPLFVGRYIEGTNLNDKIITDISLNTFSTTIGSWVFDVGILWTIIITFIHFFVFKRIGKKRLTIFNLIYVIWIYDFIFSSIFFYNETLNGSRVLSILLIVIYERILFKSSKLSQSIFK